MKLVALLFAVAWLVAPVPRTSQSTLALPQAWGQRAHGLRLGISVGSGSLSRATAEFSLALENTGDADFVLNLGSMLANGKVMFPEAMRLILTDPAGNTSELGFFDRRYPVVAGRVDPFVVPLRAGSTYVIRTSLNQYFIPATNNFDVKLASGRNRIAARFEGQQARSVNSDLQGVALLNFWKGTVESNVVDFDVPSVLAIPPDLTNSVQAERLNSRIGPANPQAYKSIGDAKDWKNLYNLHGGPKATACRLIAGFENGRLTGEVR